jgi:hypothetical protein
MGKYRGNPAAWMVMSFVLLCGESLHAQLRIVDYNTAGLSAGPRPGMSTVLDAIGDESVNGIAKPIDVLVLQEQRGSGGVTTQGIVNILNGLYGAGTYAMAAAIPSSDSTGTPGLIYNTKTVQLIEQTTASTVASNGAARPTGRYELRPVGYDSSADFYVYSSHYKSSDTSADRGRRNVEAQQVRANADALGQGAHIIFAGDFNVYNSNEPMFVTLTSAGNGQAFDPVNRIGNWHENNSFRDVHTQSGGAITGGGMDDRFDWQLVSGEFLDGEGLSVINGSYRAFGNTGTHILKGNISTGDPGALAARLPGYSNSQASAVLSALETASDHLPVVVDYQLPARMGVSLVASPDKVLVGANAKAEFSVSNTAPVVAANGADELDYLYASTGDLTGSGSGTDAALGGANSLETTLLTGTAGEKTGTLNVTATSQAAASPNYSQTLSYTVLDHAQASFSPFALTQAASENFGMLDAASGPVTLDLTLSNLLTASGYTAGLDLDGITVTGDTAWFTLDLGEFTKLAAGGTVDFDATFLGGAPMGVYEVVYEFALSDEDLPGALSLSPLTLTLTATVVPEPAVGSLVVLGISMVFLRRKRAA